TLNEWAIVADCEPHTLRMRLFTGIPLETAVTMKHREHVKAALHTVNGVSKTLRKWAEHAGVTYGTLFARLRSGRTLAEAIAMPKGQHRPKGAGVSRDFKASMGTGAGSTLQATQNITSKETAQ